MLLGPDGHPLYGISTPSAWDEIKLRPEALAAVQSASALCFGTLAQREPVSRATIRTLVESAGSHCVRIHDVNVRLPFCSEEVVRWSLLHADIVKISEEELAFVCGLLNTPQSLPATGTASVKNPEVGAGDAFTAGMAYAYLRGAPLAAVNRAANLCGSYVASRPGATPPFSASLLEELQAALTV